MMHTRRRYAVEDVADAASLAEKLTEHTWCGCNAFRLRRPDGSALIFANATCPDGAQEFAVVLVRSGQPMLQIESLTASWMTEAKMLATIESQLPVSSGDRCSAGRAAE